MYTDMDMWIDVRRRVLVDGESKRSVIKRYGIHWKTLEKILGNTSPPGYRMQQARPKLKIAPFLPVIVDILKADTTAPRKQRHTVKRIHGRLRSEHGYTGGYTSVKDAVRELQATHKEVFVPLLHPPGEAQVDFGFAQAVINGQQSKVALFVMTLPFSDAIFLRCYPRECTESFVDGHVKAFAYFKGVPHRISYDNSKIAVARFTGGRGRDVTFEFQRLESHFMFKHHFCLVRRPNEKGHVENLVKFSRNNFMVPVPCADSYAALNTMLEGCCRTDLDRQVRGKPEVKAVLLEQEREAMLELPTEEYDAGRLASVQVNSLSLARFDNNDYSVPVAWAHRRLTVSATVDEVRLSSGSQQVAVHRRCWERERVRFDPVHYLALLERKPGAFDYARPLEHWELPDCFHLLRRRLESEFSDDGTRRFIKVLRLLEGCTLGELARAVERTLDWGIADADAVRLALQGLREEPATVFSLDGHCHLSHVQVHTPDLTAYGRLLHELGEEVGV